MQISKAISGIINVSDLILKMKDCWLQGVIPNTYQLQLNNLITCIVGYLSILTKSCTDLNHNRRDNMKDQLQPSQPKLAKNVPAGLLLGDELAGRISSFNNTTNMMKTTEMISSREVFGKNPKTFQPSWRSSSYRRRNTLARATHSPIAIQLGIIDSRSKADTLNTDWPYRSFSYLWFVTKSWMFHSWKDPWPPLSMEIYNLWPFYHWHC